MMFPGSIPGPTARRIGPFVVAAVAALLALASMVEAGAPRDGIWLDGDVPANWELRLADPGPGLELSYWFEVSGVTELGAPTTFTNQGEIEALFYAEGSTVERYETEADFRDRAPGVAGLEDTVTTVQLDGIDFFFAGYDDTENLTTLEHYYGNVPGGHVEIFVFISFDPGAASYYPAAVAEADDLVARLRFDLAAPVTSSTSTPPVTSSASAAPSAAADDDGWKTVVGGTAAVMAAAAALAAAAATARDGRGEPDPDTVVGHVLQLSADRLQLSTAASVPLTTQVWQVHADGRTSPAPGVQIQLAPPTNVAVEPSSGAGMLDSLVVADQALADPGVLTVTATAPGGGTTATVQLDPTPQIDARPDVVELVAGSGSAAEVTLWVDPPAAGAWTFTAHWRDETGPSIATFTEPEQTAPAMAVVRITEAAPPGRGEQSTVERTLVAVAEQRGFEAVERYIKVLVSSEGLFVTPIGRDRDGTFHLAADGSGRPTDVEVRVLVLSPSGEVAFDAGLAESVRFRPDPDTSASPGTAAWGHAPVSAESLGARSQTHPVAVHRFTCPRVVPTGKRSLPVRLIASVPGRDDAEAFSVVVPFSLVGVDTEPFSAAWNTELERCRHVIDTFVPEADRPRLHAMVDRRARTFGAEGLYVLRHQLWSFAETEVTREAHDHLDRAWWYQQVEDTLDWVSWCGDIALGVATGSLVGTGAAVAVGMLKPTLVSAVTVWVNDGSLEDWAFGQVDIFGAALEGAATDVDLWAKLMGGTPQAQAGAWAAYLAYSFARNLSRGQSVVEAMENVCRDVRDQALISFLRRFAGTSPLGAPDGDDARTTSPDGEAPTRTGPDRVGTGALPESPPRPVDSATAKRIIGRMKHRNGKPYADPRDVLDILADPEATRSLKEGPLRPDVDPVVREAFENTRQEIYDHHDADLKRWVEDNVSEARGRKVEVREIRGKKGDQGFNTDRDYVVVVEGTDPMTGEQVWIEVPAHTWRSQSHEIFAKHTGGPTGDADAARHWAESRQQHGTDQWDPEACLDYADQQVVVVTDADGRERLVRTTKERTIDRVRRGETVLQDPKGLARVHRHKVAAPIADGFRGEAYAQASKQVREVRGIWEGYEKNPKVGDPPEIDPEMRRAMDIVERTGAADFDDPAAIARADAELRGLGIDGLEGFSRELGRRVESLESVPR